MTKPFGITINSLAIKTLARKMYTTNEGDNTILVNSKIVSVQQQTILHLTKHALSSIELSSIFFLKVSKTSIEYIFYDNCKAGYKILLDLPQGIKHN